MNANGIETLTDVQFGAKWLSNDSSKDVLDFYNEMTLDIEDIVKDVLFYLEQPIDGSNIVKLKPKDLVCNGSSLFVNKEYYFNGDCFALQLPDCLKKAGPLEIVFDFFDKTDIFIHHIGQFLSPNSR